MLYVLLVLIALGGWLYCLFDVLATGEGEIRILPKLGWFMVVLLFFAFGAVAWLAFGRPRSPRMGERVTAWPTASAPPWHASPEPPRGPEDDPEFLRQLNRRLRGDES